MIWWRDDHGRRFYSSTTRTRAGPSILTRIRNVPGTLTSESQGRIPIASPHAAYAPTRLLLQSSKTSLRALQSLDAFKLPVQVLVQVPTFAFVELLLMLAPRKTLWSTPLSAVNQLSNWIHLKDNDKVCDIGCGDGRILLEWAQRISAIESYDHDNSGRSNVPIPKVTFLGIDIDPTRIELCHNSLYELQQSGKIHENLSIHFVCANALESSDLLHHATIIFLYLIPRGLKLIYPLLEQHKMTIQEPLQVVSYMSKLPGATVTDRALLQVEHQPGAAWPLYYYKLS